MISRFNSIVALLLLSLAGCQSAQTPSAGMSALSISVVAEPKAGLKDAMGRVTVYDTPAIKEQGQFEKVDYSTLDDIVVWIEPASGKGLNPGAPGMTLEINAQSSAEKLAGAVSIGEQLILHNKGSATNNFYSVSDGNEFDLGNVPAGGRAQYIVRSAGLIEVLAASAKDPVARIYAAPSRWVVLTHSGASVDFNDLPPGAYKVFSWHPRLPGTESSVTLSPNQVARTTIKVGVNALPKVGPR